MLPNADEVIELLLAWQRGEIDEMRVVEKAERAIENSGVRDVPEDDPRSPTFTVLCDLGILHIRLLTPDDVPAMLSFVRDGSLDLPAAWAAWNRYMDSVNWRERRLQLLSNPFYAT